MLPPLKVAVSNNTVPLRIATLTAVLGFEEDKVHAICTCLSDEFHFSGTGPVRLDLPACAPSKSSRQTLAKSGTILGLAPPADSLARLSSLPLPAKLKQKGAIPDNVWSVTLLDAETGVLSIGGTIAREVEEEKVRGEVELQHFGDPVATSEWVTEQVDARLRVVMPQGTAWDEHFKWTDIRGAEGWWTTLMKGVWVNRAKVSNITQCLS
jgi:hypothetical protein